jgi:hypothetical protein
MKFSSAAPNCGSWHNRKVHS